ncbi:hypothetical protein MSG28_014365 [Choristoneura fumiferana]|uniref:Uncharacterized protein n=1 Tax=Choristoneura fumiferana TaxID=7141 RepID=A0ACC0JH00_CHOFU|nr:hypothetical protein MSG28_014365 [Choristoneura fumiferana]
MSSSLWPQDVLPQQRQRLARPAHRALQHDRDAIAMHKLRGGVLVEASSAPHWAPSGSAPGSSPAALIAAAAFALSPLAARFPPLRGDHPSPKELPYAR